MRKRTLVTVAALFLIPAPGVAQGLGLGAKIGTLGYGMDAGLSMGSHLVLRGGVAFSPRQLFINDVILPADISGIESFTHQKHWGCRGSLLIDARIKPHHAPPVIEDPAVTKRVDELAAPGGPLHGVI